jgi:glycosidase
MGHVTPKVSECVSNPFEKRDLYLRGSFKNWAAADDFRFNYVCNRFELVAKISGAHTFKIGDDDWLRDADFGAAPTEPGKPWILQEKGPGIDYNFRGTHRFILNMTDSSAPKLSVDECPQPPFGETTLYLRGTMNNWGAQNEYAFQYSCDAYYLNTRLTGSVEFKIADAAWTDATTFGIARSQVATAAATGNLQNFSHIFIGEQTVRLAFADSKPDGKPQMIEMTIGPKSFVDPTVQPVADPIAVSVRFDSRDLKQKSPFGSVTAGTTINFQLAALAGAKSVTLVIEKRLLEGDQKVLEYTELARIPLTRHAGGTSEVWRGSWAFRDPAVYGYYFEIAIGDKKYVYQNNRDLIPFTREEGTNGVGMVTEPPHSARRIRRFRQTVYAADFKVPDFAPDVVYYYIFPERFRNGNAENDPKPGVGKYHDKGVEFHRNWLDKPWRPNTGDGSDDVYNNDFFGGDLEGIIEKLDYIADLGANTIYMTPIFRAASNHKYDTADYKNIDPNFGSNDDFTRLTKEAAKRGIRVMLDASLNHTGSDSIYFDRFNNFKTNGAFTGAKVRKDSPYASWYTFDETQTEPNKQYIGWAGVLDLPELNKASPSFREFAYGAKDSVMKLWLDRGGSDWRMDVAPWVPDDFWREWRRAIKQHKPDTLTVAETWWDSSKFFLGDMFDSTMNYIFRDFALEYAKGGNAAKLYRNIEHIREAYPPQSFYALMNLVGSHDRERSLHYLGYRDENTDAVKIADAKQRLRLTAFLQMTLPGSPSIYYGDEVGVTGGEDPYNRATYPWADKGGKPDMALHADFKKLIAMRKAHIVLRRGSLSAPMLADENLIVLLREYQSVGKTTWAVTASSNAAVARSITVALPGSVKTATFTDAITGAKAVVKDQRLVLTVPAMFGTVLISP